MESLLTTQGGGLPDNHSIHKAMTNHLLRGEERLPTITKREDKYLEMLKEANQKRRPKKRLRSAAYVMNDFRRNVIQKQLRPRSERWHKAQLRMDLEMLDPCVNAQHVATVKIDSVIKFLEDFGYNGVAQLNNLLEACGYFMGDRGHDSLEADQSPGARELPKASSI